MPLQQMLLAIKNTNKSYLLEQYAVESANAVSRANSYDAKSSCELPSEKRWNFEDEVHDILDIATLVNSVDATLFGRTFLGRVIVEPYVLEAVVFLAEDPQGERAVRIEVTHDSEVTAAIRKGNIVALHSPCFKIIRDNLFGLLYTSEKDIFVFEESLFRRSYPSVTWQNCNQSQSSDNEPTLDDSKETEKRVSAIRLSGNKLFSKGKLSQAIEKYSEGLSMSPRNEDLLANRSLCFLKTSKFQAALDDALLVLEKNPEHVKAIHRAAQAYNGLEQFENARDLLEGRLQPRLSSYTNQLREILSKTENFIRQRDCGEYDMVELFRAYRQPVELDVADFLGPVKVENVDSKSRGLVVTKNVDAGQLLFSVKARIHMFNEITRPYPETDLLKKIQENLDGNADLLRDLTELEMCAKLRQKSKKKKSSMNHSRLKAIITEFSSSFGLRNLGCICGLWIPACYINNACYESNCSLLVYGNVCQVRTTKTLVAGTEILMQYTDEGWPYVERKSVLNSKGFECECSQCHYESRESPALRLQRDKLLSAVVRSHIADVESLEGIISEIRKISGDSPFIHHYLSLPLIFLAKVAFDYGYFGKAVEAATEAVQNWEKAGNHIAKTVHQASYVLFASYSLKNDHVTARKWKTVLKQHVELLCGSSEEGILELILSNILFTHRYP